MRFEFATAGRILFGTGVLKEAGPAARALGKTAVVVTGADSRRAEPLIGLLKRDGLQVMTFPVRGEPTVDLVAAGAEFARREGADIVVAMGGGSALDAGKAIAALATNPGDPLEYLEVIGNAHPLKSAPLPVVAIPTTAGTGTEVTRNAVLASPTHRVKVSLRGTGLLPRVAIVDPELTLALPPELTATTGMDALTQLIEPFLSCRANPFTDALCRDGMHRVARSLRRAFQDGADLAAREDMCVASLFGGLALANAGLGAVHGFAGPIGGMFAAPHGAVCAALLTSVLSANLSALRAREPGNPALTKFREMAALLTGDAMAPTDAAVEWVRELRSDLQISGLRRFGVTADDHRELVSKAMASSSMKGNPLRLEPDELLSVLAAAE